VSLHRLSIVIAFGFAAALGLGACFIDSPLPSTFRFTCEVAEDCYEGQVCSAGLCQQPCGGAEDLDCPSGAPVCLSGFCSSICPVDVDVCPDPQTCFVYEDPNSTTPPTSGICTVVCDDEYPCGGDDVCVQGVCLASCMLDTDCGSSETCLGNVCIPNG